MVILFEAPPFWSLIGPLLRESKLFFFNALSNVTDSHHTTLSWLSLVLTLSDWGPSLIYFGSFIGSGALLIPLMITTNIPTWLIVPLWRLHIKTLVIGLVVGTPMFLLSWALVLVWIVFPPSNFLWTLLPIFFHLSKSWMSMLDLTSIHSMLSWPGGTLQVGSIHHGLLCWALSWYPGQDHLTSLVLHLSLDSHSFHLLVIF